MTAEPTVASLVGDQLRSWIDATREDVSKVLGGLLVLRKSCKQRLGELLLWQAAEYERPGVLLFCAFVSPAFVAGEVAIGPE